MGQNRPAFSLVHYLPSKQALWTETPVETKQEGSVERVFFAAKRPEI
jgi:hypothetical protein